MLDVEVLNDIESLQPRRDEWDAFVESVGGEIYQSFDWLRVWLKHYGNGHPVFIFLFRLQGRLVGVLPLYAENIWLGPVRIRAAKVIGCDHTIGDCFYPTVEEPHWSEAYSIVFQHLLTRGRCDVHVIGPLSGLFHAKVGALQECVERAQVRSVRVMRLSYAEQTYFFLNGGFDRYLGSLDKKNRHELRRKQKLFDELLGAGKTLDSRVAGTEEVPQVFDDFCLAHQRHWNARNIPGSFKAWPRAREFHAEVARAIAARGRLRLLEVRLGADAVGYKYAYRFGNRLVEYLDARSDDPVLERVNIGGFVFLEQVKRACREGVEIVDSLHGRYEHKKRMGGVLLPAEVLLAYRGRSALRLFLFRGLARALDVLYYKIWVRRVSARLGFQRGRLWRSWIRTRGFTGTVPADLPRELQPLPGQGPAGDKEGREWTRAVEKSPVAAMGSTSSFPAPRPSGSSDARRR